MNSKNASYAADDLRIMERAVGNLADSLHHRDVEVDEQIRDILLELKALKVFLTRNVPEFKRQFPGIRQKVK